MPDTIRAQWLAALEAALNTISGVTGLATERDRDAEVGYEEMPRILVLAGDDVPADLQFTGADHLVATVELQLFAKGATMAAACAALETLRGKAIAAAFADLTLGGFAFQLGKASSSEIDRAGTEGHEPSAAQAVRFTVEYLTAEGDPFTLAPA